LEARMDTPETLEEEPVAGLRKQDAGHGEEVAIVGAHDGDQDGQRHQPASQGANGLTGRRSPYRVGTGDFRDRQYVQIGHIRQHIHADANAQAQGQSQGQVAVRPAHFSGDEADAGPAVVAEQAGNHGHSELAPGEGRWKGRRRHDRMAASQEGAPYQHRDTRKFQRRKGPLHGHAGSHAAVIDGGEHGDEANRDGLCHRFAQWHELRQVNREAHRQPRDGTRQHHDRESPA